MRRWPLKLKVGVYSAVLVVGGLLAGAAVILPLIYHRQLAALDREMADDPGDLIDDLERQLGPSSEWMRPIPARAIPLTYQRRYLTIEKRDGEELYRSRRTLTRDINLARLGPGMHTIRLPDSTGREVNARFVVREIGPVIVRMGTRLGTIEGTQRDLIASYSAVLPVAAVLVFAGGFLLARRALRPISAMTAAAERISAESPGERLPQPAASDELARLTSVLNESFDRLQRAYDAAARFSADASHQLKTPIAVLRAGLDELRICDYLRPGEREVVDALLQQTRRLTTLVEDLLLLAQADAGRLRLEPSPTNLAPVLEPILDDIDALAGEKRIEVRRDIPPQLFARADARRVKIILQNLGENAVKYTRENGCIRVEARREGAQVLILVANAGGMIPPENQSHLFERFNRGHMGENIKGHGLGLNIARELARAHGGDLELRRSDSEWTEFVLRLPACDAPVPGLAATAPG